MALISAGTPVCRARSTASPRSLQASASANESSKSPRSSTLSTSCSRKWLAAALASSDRRSVATSTPALTPMVSASAVRVTEENQSRFSMSLTVYPAPCGPTCMIRSPSPTTSSNGTLQIFVGGDSEDYLRMRPLLEVVGDGDGRIQDRVAGTRGGPHLVGHRRDAGGHVDPGG